MGSLAGTAYIGFAEVTSLLVKPLQMMQCNVGLVGNRLLPHVKSGGTIHLAIAGMVRDCHDAPPACLRVSWTAEQLDYIHDMAWWRKMLGHTDGVEIVSMREMSCTREAWADWIACDNDYARGDRAAVEAGALDYLSTIAVVLRKA